MKKNRIIKIICYTLLIIALIIILINIELISEILTPLLLGLIIAYILKPAIVFLEKRNIKRRLSITIVYLSILIIIFVVFIFIIPEIINSIKDLTETIPEYFEKNKVLFKEFIIRYRNSGLPEGMKKALDDMIANSQDNILNMLNRAIEYSFKSLTILFKLFLGIIISIYVLADMENIKENVIKIIPKKYKRYILDFASDINVVLSGFVRGQLFIAMLLSIATIAGLVILRINFAVLLGIIAGFTNLIPYFGPIIGAIPALIIAFLDTPIKALYVLILYAALQQVESNILAPKIVGRRVGLHPVTTLVVIYAGGLLFGFIGLLIVVPLAGILKVILIRVYKFFCSAKVKE